MSDSSPRDVVITGAGPVGLFLACELALARIDVLVVEQAEGLDSPLKLPPLGIRGLSVASAEALHRRGLLDALLASADAARAALGPAARGANAGTASPGKVQVGHFAGIAIDPGRVDPSRRRYWLPNPAGTNFAVDMASVESVLAARAQVLGVEVRRGQAVRGVEEHGDAVTVRAGALDIRARWLVGCDGGRGAVRKLAGFECVETAPEFTAYYAAVDLADPEKLKPGRHATPAGFYMHQPGQVSVADFDGGAFDRSQPITAAHLQAVLRRVSGTDVTVASVRSATSFTDRTRLVTSYRQGRVLLAGDAAHIHSALGGQGLNAGLGDAMNLGWKLAATVRGTAPASLLETYQAERQPVGQWVVDWSRAQSAIMRPTAHGRALEGIVRDLAGTRDGATYFAERLWGLSLHYERDERHPLVGCSAPDLQFEDGSRLAHHLHPGCGVLFDLAGDAPLRQAMTPWQGRIRTVSRSALDDLGLAALLVRPDGFVAWASDRQVQAGQVESAATRWFGLPDPMR